MVTLASALDSCTSTLALAYALPPDAPIPATGPRRSERRFDPSEAAGRLGRAVRLARLLRGLGRRGVVSETFVDRGEVRRIESGHSTSARLSDIHALAAALTDNIDEAATLFRALVALYADDETARRRVVTLVPDAGPGT